MRISNEYKLVFVSTPKTGSHSGWKLMDDNFPISNSGMHNNIVPLGAKDFNAFTFVRNPYTRAISIWNSLFFSYKSDIPIHKRNGLRYRSTFLKQVGSDDFTDFCYYLAYLPANNPNPKLLSNQYNYHKNTNLTNLKYFQIETINETLPPYIKEVTGKDIIVPYELKRSHSNWDKLKTEKVKEYILKWAEQDFTTFGYKP